MDSDVEADVESLRAELVALNYPWPKILKSKDARWLETELRLLKNSGGAMRHPKSTR